MKYLSVLFLAASLALLSQTGCGKKETKAPAPAPAAPQPKAPTAEVAAPDAAPPPPAPDATAAAAPAAAAAPEAVTDQDLIARVVGALQNFYFANNRGARSMEELVNGGFLKSVPQIPGKKVILNPGATDPKDLVKIVPQ